MEKKFKECLLLENVKVKRELGEIADVKILGSVSRNKRKYSPTALDSVVRLAEGIKVVCDHSGNSVKDLIGSFTGVYRDGNSVYGTLNVLKESPASNLLFECAENCPSLSGMSIDGQGKFSPEMNGDYEIVEDVLALRNVAWVLDPATTSGLWENKASGELETLKRDNESLKDTNAQLKKISTAIL